jgi:multidrug efflux pump subunit AcrB
MDNLVRFFVENNKFTLVLTLFMIVIGLMGFSNLSSESYPSVNMGTAIVTTTYRGAGALEVETEVTKPIEDEIRTVRGIKDVRSTSQSGLSKIVIRVDMDNYDAKEVMDDIQKAIQRVNDLPKEIKDRPAFKEIKSEEFPAIELAVLGDNTNRKRDLFTDYLKEVLEDNKRVLNVRLTGYREREFSVKIKQKKLDEYHLEVGGVLSALKSRNKNIPAGNLINIDERLLVKLDGKVKNISELEAVPIRSNYSNQRVLLSDIAVIEDGMEEATVLAKVNGENATLITVTKKGGEDTIALVNDVESKLKKIVIPEGIAIEIYNNESNKVKNRMEVLTSNAVSGLVLVIFFLFLFLPGKIGLIASLSLPITVMAMIGLMPYMGMNLNAITILAMVIALGMLVDNSVVISENYTRLKQTGMNSKEAVIKSVQQIWLPISCTAFTTIAAFLPMLVTKGIMGRFIKFIPIIVSLSLLLSLFESFFLLPMRLAFAEKRGKKKEEKSGYNDWFHKLSIIFENMMRVLIKRRYLVAFAFSIIILGSLFMLVKVNKFILFPAEQTEIYIARFETKSGTSVEATSKVSNKLALKVKEILKDDVAYIVTRSGVSQNRPQDPKAKDGKNVGIAVIYVTREASFKLYYSDVLDSLRKIKIPELEKLSFEVQINGPPVGEPVNATFRSNNMQQLNQITKEIALRLKNIKGIINPQVNDVFGEDEVHVNLDYDKIAQMGLDVNLIGQTIKTAIEGSRAAKINLNNKEFDLKVKLHDDDKQFATDISKIKILDKKGNLIPVANLAKIERKPGTPYIKRFDFLRAKTITAEIDEKFITSIEANKLLSTYYEELKATAPEVTIEFGGEQESTRESMDSLKDAMILALIAISAILVFLFHSFLKPIIIMTTIPLGLLGVSVAFYFHARPVSFLAMIGIIGLAGIIVNSGIVLISFIDDMKAEGELSLDEILVKASGMRLRAVVVTSLTTISGLFPTAYGIGGRDLILIPMTLAMAWGLTSGTILTLIWIPCAYGIIEDFSTWSKKIFVGKKESNINIERI